MHGFGYLELYMLVKLKRAQYCLQNKAKLELNGINCCWAIFDGCAHKWKKLKNKKIKKIKILWNKARPLIAQGKLNNFGLDTLKLSISMATSSPCLRFVPDVVMVDRASSWADPDVQHAKSAVLHADLTFVRYAGSSLFSVMVVDRWRHQRCQPSTWSAVMGDYPGCW